MSTMNAMCKATLSFQIRNGSDYSIMISFEENSNIVLVHILFSFEILTHFSFEFIVDFQCFSLVLLVFLLST